MKVDILYEWSQTDPSSSFVNFLRVRVEMLFKGYASNFQSSRSLLSISGILSTLTQDRS